MSEVAEAGIQHIRGKNHVLAHSEDLEGVKEINGIRIDGAYKKGSSGWLLNGTIPDENNDKEKDWNVIVKLAKDPQNIKQADASNEQKNDDTGLHYEYNAKILREANNRTFFVPLYFGHGVTELSGYGGEFPYLVMERIKGKSLEEIITTQTMDTQESFGILRTIARGVDELLVSEDGRPIISTDLKPSNIMIRSSGKPVLIDFDIALHEGDSIDVDQEKGLIRGSVPYAGPEQAQDGAIITRELNTWQIGAIAFEMLTHERFMNIGEVLPVAYHYGIESVYNEFLERRLSEVDLPQRVKDVFAKALAFNAAERPSSSLEFVNVLDKTYRLESGFSRRKGLFKSTFDRASKYLKRPRGAHETQTESVDAVGALDSIVKEPSTQSPKLKEEHILQRRRPLTQKLNQIKRSNGYEYRDTTRPDTTKGRHRMPINGRHRVK